MAYCQTLNNALSWMQATPQLSSDRALLPIMFLEARARNPATSATPQCGHMPPDRDVQTRKPDPIFDHPPSSPSATSPFDCFSRLFGARQR